MAKVVAETSGRRWDSVLLWGFLVSLALVRAGHPEERDAFWQIRAGMENLAGVPLARPDTWGWSGVEGNWYPNSPLWNMLLALSYGTAGFWGLFVLSGVTIVALLMVTNVLGRRLGRPSPARPARPARCLQRRFPDDQRTRNAGSSAAATHRRVRGPSTE